jgi:hypothetical protein
MRASERLEDKKAVLQLVFSEPLGYDREEGSRTPEFLCFSKQQKNFRVE